MVAVHPDEGLEEGIEGDHLGGQLKWSELLIEERERFKNFGKMLHGLVALDGLECVESGEFLGEFERECDFGFALGLDFYPLASNYSVTVLNSPAEELHLLENSMIRHL